MRSFIVKAVAVAAVAGVFVCAAIGAEDAAKDKAAAVAAAKPQATCPVMGGAVNPKLYADVDGFRVYACCAECIDKIKAEPAKYLAVIAKNGETAEKLPAADAVKAEAPAKQCCKAAVAAGKPCDKCAVPKDAVKGQCCKDAAAAGKPCAKCAGCAVAPEKK